MRQTAGTCRPVSGPGASWRLVRHDNNRRPGFLAERVNGILKGELLLHRPRDLQQARQMVKKSVAIYNHERPHLSLKCRTPDEVHQAFFRQNQPASLPALQVST